MHWLYAVLGFGLVVGALRDAFMAILLPRTVGRGSPLTRRFMSVSWRLVVKLVRPGVRYEDLLLSTFGPLSIVGLIAIWAAFLIIGFGFVVYGLQIPLNGNPGELWSAIYLSGVTFLTLGFGDVVMTSGVGRVFAVTEAGTGFGFLAIVVSYLPVLYNSFSRREVLITLMDARGGSPPSGGEMIRRFAKEDDWKGLTSWLERWETWAAELLETHLSYPTLAFYRSQHSDTSWLCAMTAVMDACALMEAVIPEEDSCSVTKRQARLTLAMCRHAVVDLTQIYSAEPLWDVDRLSLDSFKLLGASLAEVDVTIGQDDESHQRLAHACQLYSPYVATLSQRLRLTLPAWVKDPKEKDNWETSAWDRHL